MMDVSGLDAGTILEPAVFDELFDTADIIERTRLRLELEDRAKVLGVKSKFLAMYKATNAAYQEEAKHRAAARQVQTLSGETNFDIPDEMPFRNLSCRGWQADEAGGVRSYSAGSVDQIACYHPILPAGRLRNLETGAEKIRLAYKRNGRWHMQIVDKTVTASANRIVQLAGIGIAVTSENARLLVRYLADVENQNDDAIDITLSTGKLGWHGTEFVPYDGILQFDSDSRFSALYESIAQRGSMETWLGLMRGIRSRKRIEVLFLMAASFASVLLEPAGALPFIADLWGMTEGGKTVTEMCAASIWANPAESQYIGDFKTTDVALEARADMLNHLPVILDDTSRTSARIRDNFEGVVYDLCSGKGKSRSNKEIGLNRENHWRNVIITNGERPLTSYVSQGGAVNRILEIECGQDVFDDPQGTAETVRRNYGHAGPAFVRVVKEMDPENVRALCAEYQRMLERDDRMKKQAISMSVLLAADEIAERHIFRDGIRISVEEAGKILTDRAQVSDSERCYRYLLDKAAMNGQRFETGPEAANCEKWGVIDDDIVCWYPQALEDLCRAGGFSRKSFQSWALRRGIIEAASDGKTSRVRKVDGRPVRMIWMRIFEDGIPDEDGFLAADGTEPSFS